MTESIPPQGSFWKAFSITMIAVIVAGLISNWSLIMAFIPQGKGQLMGPPSMGGSRVEIKVSDRAGWGADFYTDIRVLDSAGKEVASWHDPHGQGTWDLAERFVASMRWTAANTLEFKDASGDVWTLDARDGSSSSRRKDEE